jgi:Protein of unknown function (DUF561)
MNQQQEQLLTLLRQKCLVKAIAGIDNLDENRVLWVVRAAGLAGAGAVDVAAQPEIVRLAKANTDLPVFASSIHAEALALAVEAGADAAEIGNFDALYKDGFYMTAEALLALTENTQALLPKETPLSVTVPGYLSIDAQILLADQLQSMGVTMIQTEGASRVISVTRTVQLLPADEKAQLTLQNTQVLCRVVSIPVMTASGINLENIQEAFTMGASAVGIGSAVNRLASQAEMVTALQAMMKAVSEQTSPAVELAS